MEAPGGRLGGGALRYLTRRGARSSAPVAGGRRFATCTAMVTPTWRSSRG